MKNLTVGQRVVRSKGDYVVGRVGVIIEIDEIKNRARIDWDNAPRSWVSFGSLELESIPYKIVRFGEEHRNKKTGNIPYPQYQRV